MRYYHVWFPTKFRKYMLIDDIDSRIHELFKQIAEEKRILLLASGSLLDHAHILIGLENDQSLSWAVMMLKGSSSRRICQEFKWLKQDFRVNNFWARKYGAKEVETTALQRVANYVLNQKKDLHVL